MRYTHYFCRFELENMSSTLHVNMKSNLLVTQSIHDKIYIGIHCEGQILNFQNTFV
jgi:hypothetical protein